VDFGFTEGSSRMHIGEGTTNLKFYLEDFFLKNLLMTTPKYYIQYHNADKLGYYPTPKTDFESNIDRLILDNSIQYKARIYTSKKLVEKAVGQFCFLIVGKTENFKKYYLWSFFRIDDYTKDQNNFYDINGFGYDFQNPILLNNLENFKDFKNFCGNFGIGFQNIDKHNFSSTLISLADQTIFDTLSIQNNDQNIVVELKNELKKLNEKMKEISPEKRLQEIERTLRKDKRIVELIKKVNHYKCQFPDCNSIVWTAKGINYVEVAHIKPVNEGGQSILGNLIVLCPNHHKEFDYGNLKIEKQTQNLLTGQLNGRNFQIEIH
jgi:predicted restriction endonuclease